MSKDDVLKPDHSDSQYDIPVTVPIKKSHDELLIDSTIKEVLSFLGLSGENDESVPSSPLMTKTFDTDRGFKKTEILYEMWDQPGIVKQKGPSLFQLVLIGFAVYYLFIRK